MQLETEVLNLKLSVGKWKTANEIAISRKGKRKRKGRLQGRGVEGGTVCYSLSVFFYKFATFMATFVLRSLFNFILQLSHSLLVVAIKNYLLAKVYKNK